MATGRAGQHWTGNDLLDEHRRVALLNRLRGNMVREVSDLLPDEIDLLVYA